MTRFVSCNSVQPQKGQMVEVCDREGIKRWAALAHIIGIEERGEQRITVFLTNQRQWDVNISFEDFLARIPVFHEEFNHEKPVIKPTK